MLLTHLILCIPPTGLSVLWNLEVSLRALGYEELESFLDYVSPEEAPEISA